MDAGSSIDKLFAGKGLKARIGQALFILACLAVVAFAGFGMNSCGNAQAEEKARISALISSNYSVDGVGPTSLRNDFVGYSFSIATGGVVHQCSGITKEDVLAKKPINCTDGSTITAKK